MPDGSGRSFGMNAGSYADASFETLTADGSLTAAGVAAAMARVADRQVQAAAFINASGAQAGGHDVGDVSASLGGV